jgi:phosphomannomutase
MDALEAEYGGRPGVTTDRLDGLSVGHDDWAFNVRPSNTEPLLRLNAEGKDEETMVQMRDEVLARIRSAR